MTSNDSAYAIKTSKANSSPRIEKEKKMTGEVKPEVLPRGEEREMNLIASRILQRQSSGSQSYRCGTGEKIDKLLCLQVDTGSMRQIVAGIANYAPEDLIAERSWSLRTSAAKLMGVESQGNAACSNGSDGARVISCRKKTWKKVQR